MKALDTSPKPCTYSPRPQWMSEEYLWMIDKCAALRCRLYHNRNVACTLIKSVQRLLNADY